MNPGDASASSIIALGVGPLYSCITVAIHVTYFDIIRQLQVVVVALYILITHVSITVDGGCETFGSSCVQMVWISRQKQ